MDIKNKIKEALLKGIKNLVRPIICIAIIAVLVVSLFWIVIEGVKNKVSDFFDDVSNNIKISGNNLEIDQDYLAKAKKKLKNLGVNPETLGLGNDEYLERFLEAEIVTSYPYLGGDGLQGSVYFDRAKVDGTTTELKYLEYNEFYNKVNNGDGDIRDYFTVDTNDWTVHVVKQDGTIEKINYKNMVSKFAMPFEFPICLAMVSQNPQFALAVVKLVKDSKIVITIAESKTTTTTTNTETYTRTVVDESGNVVSQENGSTEPQVSVEETYTTDVFLSSAQTWILNEVTALNYDDTTEEDQPVVTDLVSESSPSTDENGNSIVISITNRKNTKEVSRHYQRWIRGTSKVIEKTSNFTNLILRDSNIANGQGLVEVAKRCHDAIAQSGRFSYGATSGGIPIDVNTDTTVDCSGYVSWVLYEAGYKDMAGGQHNTNNDSLGAYGKDKGWEVITNINELQPGDICFWGGTLDGNNPYHVNIYVGEESGKKLYYDCGSQSAINKIEPKAYVADDFGYAFRPNDDIAKALSPETSSDLESKIRNYIDGIGNGKYGVSVRNLNKASFSVSINDNKVKSEGLIKLFIMATAYNEINKGSIKEEDVSGDIERMITSDNNIAANSILKTIGEGDIQKGIEIVNDYTKNHEYNKTNLAGELAQSTTNIPNDKTVTSVEDVSKLLTKIFDGSCVNKKYSEQMMNLLKNQLIIDMIPSTITEAETANKTGEQSGVVQDAAIISTENANYVVVISANDIVDVNEAKTNIKQIATMINNYFIENGKVKDNTNNYEQDNEIDYKMNGRRVCYKLPNGRYQCPLDNLVEGREMLFKMLGESESTQSYERLMRYLLYLLTGNDYGVTEFDFNEFLNGSFSDVSGLYGNSPQERVWWALIDAGYSAEAAAGVLGNIDAESGFNQAIIEGGNGIGFGLCQWSFGRRTQLESYAASKGVSPSDLDTQIEFLLAEITPGGGANGYATYQLGSSNHGYTADDWKNASSPEDAAEVFCWIFERPGIPRMDIRKSAARKYYDQFKNAQRPTTGGTTKLTQAADTVAKYLCDNNYTYRATDNTNYTFPIAQNGARTLSCSSFIQECLLQAGYTQAAGGEKLWARKDPSLSMRDFQNLGLSVQLITDMNALQPGDIVQYTSIYHVVMVYSVSGSNVQIKGVPEVMNNNYGYNGVTRSVSYLQQNGCYAIRINN